MTDDEDAQRLWEEQGIVVEGYSKIGDHIISNEELDFLNRELDKKIKQEEFKEKIIHKTKTINISKTILILFKILLVGTLLYTIFLSLDVIKLSINYFKAIQSDNAIQQAVIGLVLNNEFKYLVLFLIIFLSEIIALLTHLEKEHSSNNENS
ncbi:MAG: hypothetical protein ACTSWX_09235 [Promethearchaeota archaeon]